MTKLSDLYKEHEAKLHNLEDNYIKTDILPVIIEQLKPLLSQIKSKTVLAIDYKPNKELKVYVSHNDLAEISSDAVRIIPEEPDKQPILPSIAFTVKFVDGTIISNANAKQAFIEALKHMSLEKVSHYSARKFMGFPLVGKHKRTTENKHKWQEYVDGWWVYVNMNNSLKISLIKNVADFLNIPLTIEYNGEVVTTSKHITKSAKEMYSLNGSVPMNKRQTVWTTIKQYMNQGLWISFENAKNMFPKELQGSYDVVISAEEAEELKSHINDLNKRYLLNRPIHDCNNKVFYVCSQWDYHNFPLFQQHVAEKLNWQIIEVE